jgi:hypothetical protein
LAVHTSKTAVSELMRVAWRTVGGTVARGNADADARTDRLAGLTRIGIDELSYKKGRCHFSDFEDAPAENLIRAGQAACSYSWRIPPRRWRLRMPRPAICSGSVIAGGSG